MERTSGTSTTSIAGLLRPHQARVWAGLALGVLIVLLLAGRSMVLTAALAPMLLGAVVTLLPSLALAGWMDRQQSSMRRVRDWSSTRSGVPSTYVIGPVAKTSIWLWEVTERIGDRSLRSGTRLTLALYLWALVLALVTAVTWILVSILVAVAVLSFFLSGNSEQRASPDDATEDGGDATDEDTGSARRTGHKGTGSGGSCPACDGPVSSDARRCPQCGEHLHDFKLFGSSTTQCRACSATVSMDAERCPACGEDLEGFKLLGGSTTECRACGETVSTDARRCPHCDEELRSFKFFGGSTVDCRACGAQVSTDARRCPSCGEDLHSFSFFGGSTAPCRSCGTEVSTDAQRCPACGEDLESFKLFG